MLAKIISEMPLPMPRWVMSSPSHMTRAVPTVRVMTIRKKLQWRAAALSGGKAP